MALRRLRVRVLIGFAILITLFALYKKVLLKKDVPHTRTTSKVTPSKVTPHQKSAKSPKSVKAEVVLNVPKPKPIKTNDGSLYYRALEINFAQKLHNVYQHGHHTKDTIILLVQVHDRANYFKEFINSLKDVKDIEKATLVISMDKFVPEIDAVISGITFCRYMTIYFPFSMQLFPNSFPGLDPNDCARDESKKQALARKCNNAEYPDMFGHYREVKYVQIKHHWLWKLHMVFSGIKAFMGNKAPVILLEEDYYLTPDILHVAKLAVEYKNLKCSKCSLISLGNYEKRQDYSLSHQVEIHAWSSTKSNIGMLITKAFYDQISDLMESICEYDDYNWDWSLQAAMKKSMPDKLYTMQFKATRIFHLGSCQGLHAKAKCELTDQLQSVKGQLQVSKLFPVSLHVARDNPATLPKPRPNGGWGDLRDQLLCKQYKAMCQSLVSESK